ncbi:TPA: hypothetical protein ACGA31_001306 [Clostridium perfringens]
MFFELILGKNQNDKIIKGSCNETLSTMSSKNVKNAIQEEKTDKYKSVFSDVFLNVKIKQVDAAMKLWSLEGRYNNYIAISPTGIATGFVKLIQNILKK